MLRSCKDDTTRYISYPHFLHGDKMLIDQFVEGNLQPDLGKHQSYIVVEPTSGTPLELAIKLQTNILARPLTPAPVPGGSSAVDFE